MADVASLAVALHLNAASFKAQLTDAYSTAANESRKFTRQVETGSNASARAVNQMATQAKRSSGQAAQGFGQLHHVLTELVSGSNVAASTISNALVPAFERLFGSAHGTTFDTQRQMAKDAAQSAVDYAQSTIEAAKADATRAQQGLKTAQAMKAQAIAQREQALASDEYLEKMRAVNAQNGLNTAEIEKAYAAQNAANARTIAEANLAEVSANQKAAAASAQLTTAQAAETAGTRQLALAKQQLAAANTELSTLQRVTGRVASGFSNLITLMGGPVNVGLMATAGTVFYLYSQFKEAEERQKSFYAAIQKGGLFLSTTTVELNLLADRLGGTAEAYKAVTSAASAGFTGKLLEDVAEFGAKLEESGGSVDMLVSKLSAIGDQPLKALRNYAAEGVVLTQSIYEQIAALERRGQTEEAKELARTAYEKQYQENIKESDRLTQAHKKSLDSLTGSFKVLMAASTQSLTLYNQVLQKEKDKQEAIYARQLEERKAQIKTERQLAIHTIETAAQINAAINAGKDPLKERASIQQEVNQRYKDGSLTLNEYTQALKGLDKLYASPQKSSGVTLDTGRQRIEQLQQQTATLQAQLMENEKLLDSERKLAVFEQELTRLKGQTLNASQKSVLVHADEIRTQLQINAGLERELQLKALRQRFADQDFEITKRTAQMQQEAQNQILQMTMPKVDYDLMREEQRIRDDFRIQRYKLDKDVSDKTSLLYAEQTQFLAEKEQEQVEIVRNAAVNKAKVAQDGMKGLAKGWQDFGAETENVFDNMRNITKNAFDGMSNTLADFVTTGKFNFSDFAQSVVNDITRMIAIYCFCVISLF
ncbi:phage tail tape measure C-terminal domain-containing protein [Arsenophonus nasoniae]|uniref:Phage tail tape measure C-terminal domain-containing protein n=1 Tax=Arsenophonus nasoniae TaxID=638 RepID=A0AA95K4G4_9GAMM|nr:phage tail tape measure C-terminal domain-containing protein [Arsenophonus nasoniae]WGM00020.1 phage tail tape measure C-terminal domain-containing protein [Arsenophonus nasoniae]WGM00213.1 phage tail tape measure C-terminal domain-containing protein [Arsenophonus nasoniae]